MPLGGAALGSGQEALSAAAALSGLSPDSGYRFRAIATSHCNPNDEAEVCEDTGPGQAFHTFPLRSTGAARQPRLGAGLPGAKERRRGDPLLTQHRQLQRMQARCGRRHRSLPMQSSPDGEAVVYQGFPFSFSEGAVKFSEYISKRTASGWQTTTLSPLLQAGTGSGYKAFDASLTQGLLYQEAPTLSPEAPAEYANLYAQPTGCALDAQSAAAERTVQPPPAGFLKLAFAGASADLSHVFFAANDALTGETAFAPEAQDGGVDKNNLYEWSGGQLRLVNVLPGNTEAPPGPRPEPSASAPPAPTRSPKTAPAPSGPLPPARPTCAKTAKRPGRSRPKVSRPRQIPHRLRRRLEGAARQRSPLRPRRPKNRWPT